MGIDRIGKGGGLPPTGDVSGSGGKSPVDRPEKTFQVERPEKSGQAHEAASTSAASATAPTSPLARLRAGEIDVHGYVDLKVDEATRGLEGLGPAALDEIKRALRDQLRTDPGLADLVRSATGKAPTPPEE